MATAAAVAWSNLVQTRLARLAAVPPQLDLDFNVP